MALQLTSRICLRQFLAQRTRALSSKILETGVYCKVVTHYYISVYYTESHEWVKVEGSVGRIGITDHAQSALGDVVFVELPEIDSEVDIGGYS